MKDLVQQLFSAMTKKFGNISANELAEIFPRLGVLDNEKKQELEKILGIKISNPAFFEQALTHRSFIQGSARNDIVSNERLEFLGDAVLGFVAAEYLFYHYRGIQEGELTKLRAWLVQRSSLVHCAKKFQLHKFIQLSVSARQTISSGSQNILADAVESIIAAIFLDSGFDQAKKFIVESMIPEILSSPEAQPQNYKSMLLELVQADGCASPIYTVTEESGPDHEKEFTIAVLVNNDSWGIGKGKSKKQAEQQAAQEAIAKYYSEKEKPQSISSQTENLS